MPIPEYTVECKKSELVAENIYELQFAKPEGFTFKPGQFIMIDVPLLDNPEDIQPRAYSIASTNEEGHITLAVRIKEGGRAGDWIVKQLKQGTQARIQGPLGVFGFNPSTPKEYLLICTGAGLVPFRSMLKTALAEGEDRKIDLVFGAYTEKDILWREEIDALAKQYPNFSWHIALSDADDSWQGHRGFVQSLVPSIAPDCSQKSVYVCGNPLMAKDVKQHCLEDWGVPKEDFHMEGFI